MVAIAFPEMKRDLVEGALFPLLSLRQPKRPAFGIKRGSLTAQELLAANFDEPNHDLHSVV